MQKLSEIKNPGSISICNNWDSPSRQQPKIAILAMDVIANWSILDGFIQNTFIEMVGANPKPAAIIYAGFTNTSMKIKALKSISEVANLNEAQKRVFKKILRQYEETSKIRNRIAHWIWGTAKNIPNAALLINPANHIQHSLVKYERLDYSLIEVFYENDFTNATGDIQNLISLFSEFRFTLIEDHPCKKDHSMLKNSLNELKTQDVV